MLSFKLSVCLKRRILRGEASKARGQPVFLSQRLERTLNYKSITVPTVHTSVECVEVTLQTIGGIIICHVVCVIVWFVVLTRDSSVVLVVRTYILEVSQTKWATHPGLHHNGSFLYPPEQT